MSEELQEVIDKRSLWTGYEISSNEQTKAIIKNNINQMCNNWISVGFALKQARDKEFYKEDGYNSIQDYAYGEFGIKKQRASKLVKIIEKLSVNGNSPVLEDKWKEFSIAKLEEIIYLEDDQLEQVTVGTTVAEIREIKNPEKGVSTSKQESEPVAPVQLKPKPQPNEVNKELQCFDRLTAYWCKREMTVELYELAKSDKDEDVDVFNRYFKEKYIHDAYAPAHNIPGYEISFKTDESGIHFDDKEKTGYSWPLLIELVCQEAENETPASKPCNVHENPDGLKRLKEIRKEVRTRNQQPKTENGTVDAPERACSNCYYNDMDPDKYKADHPGTDEFPCNDCDDKLNHWEPKIEIVEDEQEQVETGLSCDTCGRDVQGCCDYPDTPDDYCMDGDKWTPKEGESVETVEADIIQTALVYDFDKISSYGITDVKTAITDHQKNLAQYKDCELDAPIVKREKMEMDALQCLEESFYMHDMPDLNSKSEPVQPELPILKNNDQRKEFIDAYETWPIWIDQKETGERYYRYNLTDKVAIIVKVSKIHIFKSYKETQDVDYDSEQYYLLGIKYDWTTKGTVFKEDETRTFCECSSNKTALAEYLKEFQKKGA